MSEGLGLHQIKTRTWSIFKTSAVKGEGCAAETEKPNPGGSLPVPATLLSLSAAQSLALLIAAVRAGLTPDALRVRLDSCAHRLWEGMDWLSNVLKTRR